MWAANTKSSLTKKQCPHFTFRQPAILQYHELNTRAQRIPNLRPKLAFPSFQSHFKVGRVHKFAIIGERWQKKDYREKIRQMQECAGGEETLCIRNLLLVWAAMWQMGWPSFEPGQTMQQRRCYVTPALSLVTNADCVQLHQKRSQGYWYWCAVCNVPIHYLMNRSVPNWHLPGSN